MTKQVEQPLVCHPFAQETVLDPRWRDEPLLFRAKMEADVLALAHGHWPTSFPVDQVLGWMNYQAHALGWRTPPADRLEHEPQHVPPIPAATARSSVADVRSARDRPPAEMDQPP